MKNRKVLIIGFWFCVLVFICCLISIFFIGKSSKDLTPPDIILVSIESNNNINSYYAVNDDIVSLKFKFNEELGGLPIVKIDDNYVAVYKEDDYYVAKYKVSKQFDVDYNILFEISNYYDKYGNMGEIVNKTTDDSNVIVKANNQVILPVVVTSLEFKNNKIDIALNSSVKTYKLDLIVSPSNANNKDIIWNSSNNNVASVKDGVVTVNGIGSAIISAVSGNVKAEAYINVVNNEVKVDSISIGKTNGIIYINSDVKILNLSTSISPSNATNKTIVWKSSNPNVASVSDGVVTAKSVGVTTITASCGGKSDSIKITVSKKDNPITSISLNKTSETIYFNSNSKSITLTATINPNNATNKTITWKSSNTSVATVNNGVVTAKGLGNATITATAGGKSATTKIVVKNQVFEVTGVKLNKTNDTVYLNSNVKTINLTATVEPSNATNKTVTWSSNNSNVASVNNGVVTIKNLGTAVITASAGGKSASYTINVRQKIIVIVGASQVQRLNDIGSYVSPNGYTYTKANNTLKYVFKGGSGIVYQYGNGDGWKAVSSFLNGYNSSKAYIDFHIFFPLSGNEIKTFNCDNISSSNSKIKSYALGYNNSIQEYKNKNYNIKGYVISMHPVRVTEVTEKTKKYVVSNNNSNSCEVNYRSNFKYYKFNKAIKSVIVNNYQSNLLFESLLVNIMNVNDEGKNFSFKWEYYHTDDGIHWDSKTSELYLKAMLDYSKEV